MKAEIILVLLIVLLWYINNQKIENFKQEQILNAIYKDLTLEEFRKDLKHSEVQVPTKLIKPIFHKFKTKARENKMTVDFAVKKLRHFDKKCKTDKEFMKKYLLSLNRN
jgi:hypothetical protein